MRNFFKIYEERLFRRVRPVILVGLNFARYSGWITVSTFLSLVCSVGYVEMMNIRPANNYFELWDLIFLFIWFCTYVLVLWAVVFSMASAFSGKDRTVLIARIVTSYFSLIWTFSGLYYSMVAVGDNWDAHKKYNHYRHESQLLRAGLRARPHVMISGQRAFYGINARLWSGVDWPTDTQYLQKGYPPQDFDVSVEEMLSIARRARPGDAIRFIPGARLYVFLDCLHFSVATISTLGYGDIVPKSAGAKLASDIEVVSGVILLAVALGIAFGGGWRFGENMGAAASFKTLGWLAICGCAVLFYWDGSPFRSSGEYLSWVSESTAVLKEAREGLSERARRHAEDSLVLSPKYLANWNYGNAIHDANSALGLLALKTGRLRDARMYLLEAGSTPGSPQLDNFGPDMILAYEMLRRGDRDAVLKYLDLCKLFWRSGQQELTDWESKIKRGETPELRRSR